MSTARKADVIVPVYRDTGMTLRSLESVLAHSGATLRSLIAVDDRSPEPGMQEALARLALSDSRMQVIQNHTNLGYVAACNRGLAERGGDAVLLNSDTIVTPGWLDELADVAHSDPHTACASPLSNHASICSVPAFGEETAADLIDEEAVRRVSSGLPRWTEIPTAHGFCIYLRGSVLDLVGPLDVLFSPGYNEENDWVMRAQAMGFTAKRANHAFVYHLGSQSFGPEKIALEERNGRLLAERHPHYRAQVDRFHFLLDSRVAAQAVRVESNGAIRVALDLRHLPPDPVGTETYASSLARALAEMPEIELSLIVRHENQAMGIPARLVFEHTRLEDVEIIHRPAQVFDPADLCLLFQSPVHVAITHLDLIAHRAQGVFPSQAEANRYRATSALILPAVQSVIAISEDARQEIVAEFGLPSPEIAVTPLGVDHDRFADHLHDASDQLPDLRARGASGARTFRWEETARLTVAAYRSAILRPSERSLRARRQLHDVILAWANLGATGPTSAETACEVSVPPETPCCEVSVPAETPSSEVSPLPASHGIRTAWRDLNQAVHARVRRDLGRVLSRSR